MKKTMLIEGMMCPHCEARVKQTLEALEQVEEAIVSHEKNQAEIILRNTISDAELISVIEAQGYKVTEVK